MADQTLPAGPVPEEALKWFRAKKLTPSFDHRDVWRQEHATAFTVAKAMQIDILTDIKDAVDSALAEGKTFAQFRKELQPGLEKKGWWGESEMRDPLTGETRTVQLGSPRRLEIIYRTNMETARQAGQWERIERNKNTHPYLLYELGPSLEHRVEHAAWAGILLPVDDPFWNTHCPKNGWGCKCRVRQVNKREYDRLASTGKYITTTPEIKYREWINKRTGEVERVPVGIDPGWDYNPGKTRNEATKKKLDRSEKIFATAMAAPPAPVPKPKTQAIFPQGQQVLSTVKNLDEKAIEEVLQRVPGAAPQMQKLGEFLHKRQTKTMFLKTAEMGKSNKAAKALEEQARTLLNDSWPGSSIRQAYTSRNPGKLNGFTFKVGNHVVIKAQPGINPARIDATAMAKAVEVAIARTDATVKPWTMRALYDELAPGTPGIVNTWLHELSHQIHFWAGTPRVPANSPSITEYGNYNHMEWHAEHITAWLLNRTALDAWNPVITKHIDELVELAITRAYKG